MCGTRNEYVLAYIVRVLDPENLFADILEIVEGGLSGDAVDQNEALAILHVQITHGRELLLQQYVKT